MSTGLFVQNTPEIVATIEKAHHGWACITAGPTGFNLWSMFFAVIGAVVVAVAYHLMRKVVD